MKNNRRRRRGALLRVILGGFGFKGGADRGDFGKRNEWKGAAKRGRGGGYGGGNYQLKQEWKISERKEVAKDWEPWSPSMLDKSKAFVGSTDSWVYYVDNVLKMTQLL